MIHGCGTWVGDLDGQEARDQTVPVAGDIEQAMSANYVGV